MSDLNSLVIVSLSVIVVIKSISIMLGLIPDLEVVISFIFVRSFILQSSVELVSL